jgi:hypothetical protein
MELIGEAAFRIAPLTDLDAREFGDDLPEVAELDLNPVFGLPDAGVAVAARVRRRRAEAPIRTKNLVAVSGETRGPIRACPDAACDWSFLPSDRHD